MKDLEDFSRFNQEEKLHLMDRCESEGRPLELNLFQRQALMVEFSMSRGESGGL